MDIKAYLGHAHISSTQRYVGVDVEDLRGKAVKFGRWSVTNS